MRADVRAPGPVLSSRRLARAVLARQRLLVRSSEPFTTVLDAMAGLQAQYAPSMYVGLHARVAGFERDTLTRALESREVVQATLLRSTIHLVPAADFWPWTIAVAEPRLASWVRAARGTATTDELRDAAVRLRAAFEDEGGPLDRAGIDRVVGPRLRFPVGLVLPLVRVPPSGTWERRRADRYELAERWVGPPPDRSVEDATVELVRRYLAGFGPAARTDVASWAGLPVRTVTAALARLELDPGLVRYAAEDGTELVDLPSAPVPPEDVPAPVRFLPTWDALLLVHARRTQVLPEAYRMLVFTSKQPQSVGTVLVDGAVAALWRPTPGGVDVTELEPLTAGARREVAAEAERLAAFCA